MTTDTESQAGLPRDTPEDEVVARNVFKLFGDDSDAGLEAAREGLSKDEIFERTGQVVAVRDASFTVRKGEIFVVMGLSGCGKSTLVRLLNRLIDPTSGEISVGGRDLLTLSGRDLIAFRRRHAAMVFQSFALMPHLTVLENAGFGLDVSGIRGSEKTDRAMHALDTVGLRAYADSLPHELSGGMQQRVGLARALTLNPSIMLMDEAFSALDPLIRTEMQDELLRLQERLGFTVVFVSHDLDEALRIGTRVAIMADGAITQVGTPKELITSPADDYVRSFFRDVDVSKVFTAGDIADRGVTLRYPEDGRVDPVRAVLGRRGARYGYVHDGQKRFLGVVSGETLETAQRKGRKLSSAYLEGVASVGAETPIGELMGVVAEAPCPVPVLGPDGRLRGTLSRASLLQALDRQPGDQ